MIINLIIQLKELYRQGGISNINHKTLIKNDLYNDVISCLQFEDINYDIIEYCSMLIGQHDDYINYISICHDD